MLILHSYKYTCLYKYKHIHVDTYSYTNIFIYNCIYKKSPLLDAQREQMSHVMHEHILSVCSTAFNEYHQDILALNESNNQSSSSAIKHTKTQEKSGFQFTLPVSSGPAFYSLISKKAGHPLTIQVPNNVHSSLLYGVGLGKGSASNVSSSNLCSYDIVSILEAHSSHQTHSNHNTNRACNFGKRHEQ